MPSFPSLMVQRYNKIEKQRDFKAPQALSGDTELTARAANVLNSVAKVQHNFETTKDLAKKNCLLLHHSALIAGASVKAAHGAALLSELSSTEEPGCAELLRPAVCSFRTIASILRRMEVYAASRRDLANAIQSYNDNDSITSSSNRLHWS